MVLVLVSVRFEIGRSQPTRQGSGDTKREVTISAELRDPVGLLRSLLQVRVFERWKSLRLPLLSYAFYGFSPSPKLHCVDQRREDDPADDIAEPVASFF